MWLQILSRKTTPSIVITSNFVIRTLNNELYESIGIDRKPP